jgi:2-octaprenyl-6-methoxyphenol hydroxylase
LIRVIGGRWSYPLSAMIVQRYVDRRLVLAGDAAHGIHPIAGQGLNLGFRDSIDLATIIVEAARSGEDPGGSALLARYQRVRRSDNLLMFYMTDAIDRLFSTDRRVLRVARDLSITAVNRFGPLNRMFERRAMGLPSHKYVRN